MYLLIFGFSLSSASIHGSKFLAISNDNNTVTESSNAAATAEHSKSKRGVGFFILSSPLPLSPIRGLCVCRFDTIHVTSNDITNSHNRNQKVFPIFRSRKHHAKNNVRFLFAFFFANPLHTHNAHVRLLFFARALGTSVPIRFLFSLSLAGARVLVAAATEGYGTDTRTRGPLLGNTPPIAVPMGLLCGAAGEERAESGEKEGI